MIIPNGKKAVSVILGKMKPEGEEGPMSEMKDEHEMDSSMGPLKVIAEDILMAVDQKSPHALMEALKAFMSEMQGEDQEQDEQEQE